MKLKSAIEKYLRTKEELRGYRTYKSVSKWLMVPYNLSLIDMAGDMDIRTRKAKIIKTRALFEMLTDKMNLHLQTNTVFLAINILKSVLHYTEDETGMLFWTGFKMKREIKDIVILDIDFTKRFIRDDFNTYNCMPENLRTVYELACVMLTTSLRFSDAIRLTESDFSDNKVIVKNQKTGVITACPVPFFVLDRLNMTPQGIYTNRLGKHTYYRLLPKLLELYGLDSNITFHVFRKTAISIMLAMGVPQTIVMGASGHVIGSKAFQRYVANVEKVSDQKINTFQNDFYYS